MMAEGNPTVLRSIAGIKRDGTVFEGEHYTDGQWVRFQRGLPRKMGGIQGITSTLPERVRGMTSTTLNNINYLHLGSTAFLTQVRITSGGLFAGQSNRTPGAYSPSAETLWQFDVMSDGTSGNSLLIAHAGRNLNDISSTVETPIYLGSPDGTGALTASGMDPNSGGVVVLAPFLFGYGNNGRVDVSDANDPNSLNDSAFITGQKIVYGLPLRGSGSGPSGLFWSLDSLIRAVFNPSITEGIPFSFDTITTESSILSSQSVIEYDGIYYWAGVDRFLMFNGVVREVPNSLNLNWFYDNLNFSQRQKVFAYKVPRWGEIWWCYPRGSATECTHAVIYNVRENTWYDTQLLGRGRTAGLYAKVYNRPFMSDLDPTGDNTNFTLWQNEIGTDSVNGNQVLAIQSYFQTADISLMTLPDKPQDQSLRVSRIEQDFVQQGPMTCQVLGRANARAPEQASEIRTFPAEATDPSQETVQFKDIRRIMRFKFESNVQGGDYQMGQNIAHIAPADGRIRS